MNKKRWEIYFNDLVSRGLKYFLTSRLKKHQVTRKLWYLGKQHFVTVFGNKLFINKMDTVVSEKLMETGVWEAYVTKLFIQEAKKAKLIVDVGANIGYFSVLGGRFAKVISFEPETDNFNLLKRTVDENKLLNINPVKQAVGNKNGWIRLYKCRDNKGDHRVFDSGDNRETEKVEVITLDRLFSSLDTTIDILKIDIQGYDMKAVAGAKKLLAEKRIKVIFGELWPSGLKLAGDGWQEYIKLLEKSGFELWEIDDGSKKLVKFSPERVKRGIEGNPEFTMNFLGRLRKN